MDEVRFNNLSRPQLLLEINHNGSTIDIHNDFDCITVESGKSSLLLKLKKSSAEKKYVPQTHFNFAQIEFRDFQLENVSKLLSENFQQLLIT